MVLAPVILAAVVAAGPAAPRVDHVASTYDEAACDEADLSVSLVDAADAVVMPAYGDDSDHSDCHKPSPPPAFLDCNDPLASVWVGDMIGTCDMPKSASPMARMPARFRAERPTLPLHHHSSVGTSDDHAPLGVSSYAGHSDPALLTEVRFVHSESRLPLGTATENALICPTAPRLDRPPRV